MQEKKMELLRLLLQWAGAERYKLYAAVGCALLSSLLAMAPYAALYQMFEAVYYERLTRELTAECVIIVLLALGLRSFLVGAGILFSHKGAYNALYRVRTMLTDHMAKVPLGALHQRKVGEIKKILSEDIEKLELFLAHHLVELVLYAAGPLAVFLYLGSVHWGLALLTLAPLPAAVWMQMRLFAKYEDMRVEMNGALGKLNAVMLEYINGMKLIKAYNLGGGSYKKYAEAICEHHQVWEKVTRRLGPLFAGFIIVLQCAAVVVVPLGGFLFIQGKVAAGALILFFFVGTLYLLELRPLLELGSGFSQALNGVKAAKELLAMPVFTEGGDPFPREASILFDKVSFSYTEDEAVLKEVSFFIATGEKVAFIGPSGAGKSTIMQLVARFYDVRRGAVRIGGVDVRQISYEKLLAHVAVVFQTPFLTRGSVLENIRMGTKATFEQVRQAAKEAQIHEFIETLPDRYQTLVGSYGSRFSGGEKQRIALARALVKEAPILILDEASSATDPETQQDIQAALKKACQGKTVLVVAHRLELARACDRIAVVENGRISGLGTHEELLGSNEYYQRTWRQFEALQETSGREISGARRALNHAEKERAPYGGPGVQCG